MLLLILLLKAHRGRLFYDPRTLLLRGYSTLNILMHGTVDQSWVEEKDLFGAM